MDDVRGRLSDATCLDKNIAATGLSADDAFTRDGFWYNV